MMLGNCRCASPNRGKKCIGSVFVFFLFQSLTCVDKGVASSNPVKTFENHMTNCNGQKPTKRPTGYDVARPMGSGGDKQYADDAVAASDEMRCREKQITLERRYGRSPVLPAQSIRAFLCIGSR